MMMIIFTVPEENGKKVLTMAEYIEREKIVFGVLGLTIGDPAVAAYADAVLHQILPSADVAQVRHGRWLPQVVLGQKAWDCSECKTLGSPHWKWCPVCGAKMDG